MERGIEILELRLADVVGVHGLDQVGPAKIEQSRVVGRSKLFLEGSQLHRLEWGNNLERPPDMNDENLVITETACGTCAARQT